MADLALAGSAVEAGTLSDDASGDRCSALQAGATLPVIDQQFLRKVTGCSSGAAEIPQRGAALSDGATEYILYGPGQRGIP